MTPRRADFGKLGLNQLDELGGLLTVDIITLYTKSARKCKNIHRPIPTRVTAGTSSDLLAGVSLCVCVCVSKIFWSKKPAAQVAEHFLDAIPMWDITHSYTGHCEMTDICDTIGQLLLGKEPAAQGSEYILDDPWMCLVELLHQ